ncbi:Cys-every-fifth RiPP peptide CefA [Microseira sp. BLCC-F43]|uniref:Cys-every-fifth RiPP peptide CefA n=1 Tax=Microseira sp. BLCC-F43 TaxID=3153602 RepID=UPI0035B9A1DC
MQYLVKPLVNHAGNSPLFYQGNAKPNVDRIYVIASVKSKLVLSQLSDGIITQEKWTESERQQWKIVPLENSQYVNGNNYLKGTCKIECVANQRVLEVPHSSTEDEAVLGAWNWGNTNNQKWRLVELDRGVYRIENINSSKVIDVPGSSTAEGSEIVQYQSQNGDNQKWLLSEVTPAPEGALFEKKATVYKNDNFNLPSQELGLGTYYIEDLEFGNDQISSVRVPEGVRVIMYEHADFKGDKRMLVGDYDLWSNNDFNDKTSAILVEEVATFYQDTNYSGKKLILGIGRYDLALIGGSAGTPPYGTGDFDINWKDIISSMKVPSGLLVTLYEHHDFTGRSWVFNEDVPDFSQYSYPGDFLANNQVCSIIIKAVGVVIPNNVLNFGDTISFKSDHSRRMAVGPDEKVYQWDNFSEDWTMFEIWRAGDTKYNGIVSYGDIIALKNKHTGKYLSVNTNNDDVICNETEIGSRQKFTIVRAGNTGSNVFVCQGDVIALKTVPENKYLSARQGIQGWDVWAMNWLDNWEKWRIDSDSKPQNTPSESDATSVCGLEACPNDICGAAACGAAAGYANVCAADACGAAACGVDGSLVSACGAATSGIAVCGQDFLGAGISGVAACGAAVGGIGACGADACGGAACGVDACGAAACGAAGCGADVCGAAACGIEGSGGEACGADTGGLGGCGLNACGANACAIDACPADACAADACAIDVIPIIPGI